MITIKPFFLNAMLLFLVSTNRAINHRVRDHSFQRHSEKESVRRPERRARTLGQNEQLQENQKRRQKAPGPVIIEPQLLHPSRLRPPIYPSPTQSSRPTVAVTSPPSAHPTNTLTTGIGLNMSPANPIHSYSSCCIDKLLTRRWMVFVFAGKT
jgi:hypothetical protein